MLNPQEEVTSESEEAPLQQGTQTPNLQDEVTSDSQPEIAPVPKAKAKPKPKQPKRKQLKRRRRIQALEPVARHTEETSSSGSIETKRLRAARAKWNTASTSTQTQAAEVTSDSDNEAMQSIQFEAGCSTRPVTSGLFDFCDYIVQHILDEDGQTQIIKKPYCYMDFCAGLGTSVICTEAVRRSLQTVGKELDATCVCLTEKCPKKLAVLKRYNSGATIFADTTAAAEDLPRDCDGKCVERPCADILFQGIVCVDISSLSSTPKSLLNKHGKSGQAWESTLTYLRKTPYEHRPKAMVLECVSNLSKRRAVDKCLKRGTEQVSEQLQEFGYVGRFVEVSSHKFFLPQHRPRVWGLFLKLSCGLGPKGVSEREAKVEKAFDFVSRCQLDSYEPHKRCVATPQGRGSPWRTSSSSEEAWQNQPAPQDQFYAEAFPNRGRRACRSDKFHRQFHRPPKAIPVQQGAGRSLAEAVPPAEKGEDRFVGQWRIRRIRRLLCRLHDIIPRTFPLLDTREQIRHP